MTDRPPSPDAPAILDALGYVPPRPDMAQVDEPPPEPASDRGLIWTAAICVAISAALFAAAVWWLG